MHSTVPLILFVAGALVGCGGPADVLLAPPAKGFQFAIPPFEVPKASETQRCYFFEVPSETPVFVNRFELAQNAGSHHANIFRVKTVHKLGGQPGESVVDAECWVSSNWADWPLVSNSQDSTQASGSTGYSDFHLPEGVGERFEPHELLMLQTHYVNASTQKTPLHGKVAVNFHTVEEAQVTAELGTMFATNQSIKVCPHQTDKYFESKCGVSSTTAVTIIGANSHFHSRGTYFSMSVVDSAGVASAPFYENRRWDDPKMAWSLNVPVPAGSAVQYRCEYSAPGDGCGDPTQECCFTFGGHVESQEHCNIFVYYYPKVRDVGCF